MKNKKFPLENSYKLFFFLMLLEVLMNENNTGTGTCNSAAMTPPEIKFQT
jgi:hypothetical protein